MNRIFLLGSVQKELGSEKSCITASVNDFAVLLSLLKYLFGEPSVSRSFKKGWAVSFGKIDSLQYVEPDQLSVCFGQSDIYISPPVEGKAPVFFAAFIAIGVPTAAAATAATFTAVALTNFAISLAVSGITGLLSSSPDTPDPTDNPESERSTFFNGPTNTQAEGAAIPVSYGRSRVVTIPIATALDTEEVPV